MEFVSKCYEEYGRKYLESYCCNNQVKITLTSSEKHSPDLKIEKMLDASEDIDMADCFMEFLLYLISEYNEYYVLLEKIKGICFLI